MKLLLFSDLHCDAAAAANLVRRAAEADIDVVIGAGDFANGRAGIAVCIDILRAIDRPAILVPGNNESADELRAACRSWRKAHVLHGSGVTVGGISFYGLGGGVPVTPFGAWSYDFSEAEATALLANCPPGGVLVTHSPPKGAVDRSSRGDSLGSTAVRDTVLRCRPHLVVCGHIHGSAGCVESLGESTVINAGPFGIIWDLA